MMANKLGHLKGQRLDDQGLKWSMYSVSAAALS